MLTNRRGDDDDWDSGADRGTGGRRGAGGAGGRRLAGRAWSRGDRGRPAGGGGEHLAGRGRPRADTGDARADRRRRSASIELGIHAKQFNIRDGDRELVPVRFDHLPTDYPYTLMVPQNITEQVLLDRLEELGGTVHRPYVATGVTQSRGRSRGHAGQRRRDQGPVRRGRRRHEQHDPRPGRARVRQATTLAAELHPGRRPGGEWAADGRGLLFFSTAPACSWSRRCRTGRSGSSRRSTRRRSSRMSRIAQRLLDVRGPQRTTARVTEVIWGSRFRIHERVADRVPRRAGAAGRRRRPHAQPGRRPGHEPRPA